MPVPSADSDSSFAHVIIDYYEYESLIKDHTGKQCSKNLPSEMTEFKSAM